MTFANGGNVQEEVEKHVSSLYERVSERWEAEKANLFEGQCGYSILASPPAHRPPLMIIGENPGFGADDLGGGPHLQAHWPTAPFRDGPRWALKDQLIDMFRDAGLPDILLCAVVTNFLFFKSGSLSRQTNLRWSRLAPTVRGPLEAFCRDEVRMLVDIVEPAQIMVLGMAAFDKHVKDRKLAVLARDGKRWLIGSGQLWGVPAFGVMHPTGAYWADEDRREAPNWLRARFDAGERS